MRWTSWGWLAAICLTLSAFPVRAAEISFGPERFDLFFGKSIGAFDQDGATIDMLFPLFDPALGELTGVQVSVAGILSTSLYLRGEGQSPMETPFAQAYAQGAVTFEITDPRINLGTLSSEFGGTDAQCSLPYQFVCDQTGFLTLSTGTVNQYDGAFLARFTGLGQYAITGRASLDFTNTLDGCCGVSEASHDSAWTGDAQVTYRFTPASVPEPSLLLILGLSLAGVAAARRR